MAKLNDGKNSVQFRRRFSSAPYCVGDVAGFDGPSAKILIDGGYAVLLGEDTADPIPKDQDVDTEPQNLAEAVRKRLRGESAEILRQKQTPEEVMEDGELRWWSQVFDYRGSVW